MKKKISVVIPTYNEEANVVPLAKAIVEVMERDLSNYDYEILFIDNHSKDNTQALLRGLCGENKRIKAIFNARNFGQARSPVYGMKQAYGDCVVRMCADFQDPVEMIPVFVKEWEKGHKIVIGVKNASQEKKRMYWLRGMYYKMIRKITDIDHIEQFTGFGLYDKKFVDVVRDLHDSMPYLRGIIAELGFDYKAVPYTQPRRRAGKSKNNFYSLYDYAMIGITSYSKVVMRLATFAGFIIGGLSFLAGLVYLVLKLMYWDRFSAGVAPMVIGVFFLGALQLFFIGFLGEYVLSINTRVLDRPLVVEEERLNFEEEKEIEEDVQKLLEDMKAARAYDRQGRAVSGVLPKEEEAGKITPETLAALGMLLKQYTEAAKSAAETVSVEEPEKTGKAPGEKEDAFSGARG